MGTSGGDEANLGLFSQLHAFIEPLRQSHGALHAEAQLTRGILLELAGSERRRWTAPAFFLFYATNRPLRLFQFGADSICRFLIPNFKLVAGQAHVTCIEGGGLAGGQVRIHGPVFLFLESLDLALTVYDET